MDLTIITGLASLFGCLAMFLVCAAQVQALLAAIHPAPARAWDADLAPKSMHPPIYAAGWVSAA